MLLRDGEEIVLSNERRHARVFLAIPDQDLIQLSRRDLHAEAPVEEAVQLGAGRLRAQAVLVHEPLAQRFEMLEEAIQVCLQMWSDDDGPFEGRHYQLAETLCRPAPVSSPRPRVMIGGGGVDEQGLFGKMLQPVKAMVLSKFVDQEMGMMMAEMSQNDLKLLAGMMQSGKVKPVIDRTYKSLSQIPEAIRYIEKGHARGKVIITID